MSSSLKRISSLTSYGDGNDDDNNDNTLLLSAQNNSLTLELIKYKRSIQLARKELSLLRKRSSSMEHVVSILQRLWSQLEIGYYYYYYHYYYCYHYYCHYYYRYINVIRWVR